jgi:hypothetical protein
MPPRRSPRGPRRPATPPRRRAEGASCAHCPRCVPECQGFHQVPAAPCDGPECRASRPDRMLSGWISRRFGAGPFLCAHAVRSPAAGDGHGTQTPRQPRYSFSSSVPHPPGPLTLGQSFDPGLGPPSGWVSGPAQCSHVILTGVTVIVNSFRRSHIFAVWAA